MNKKQEMSLQKVRSVIERLMHEKTAIAPSGRSSNQGIFPVAIDEPEGEALKAWVVKEKAVHTIEIGLAYGVSSLFICEGLLTNGKRGLKHTILDPYQKSFKNYGLRHLKEAGLQQVIDFYPQESQITLPRFITEGRVFDFAFVDGSHLFDKVFLDLILLGQLVKPEGIIFADDYDAKAVAKAISFCVKNLKWKLEGVSPKSKGHRWAVLRTPRKPVPRSYPHFVNF